jgi:hypothetical protein
MTVSRSSSVRFCLILLCFGFATAASPQVLEYEGFNYPGVPLDGQNLGAGWGDNPWADPDLDTSLSDDGISLTFPVTVNHPAPEGSRVVFTLSGEAERRLGTTIPLAPEGSAFFFSALVKREGDFRFEFLDNGVNVRWRFGANGVDGIVGVSGDAVAPGIFPATETVYVVAKMLTRATAADQVFMNVYRAGQVLPASEPATWQASGSGASTVTLTRFQIRNITDLPLEIDEIRIGTNWADVVGPVLAGPPVVTSQPASATVYEGVGAQLTVEASGALPLSYQWLKGGQPIPNATNALFVLGAATPADAGTYTVRITNSFGITVSDPAVLTVIGATNVTVGLKALWHFDETFGLSAADASPNMNHGTLFNFVGDDSQWIASDYNGALSFNAAAMNYVEVPHHASIGDDLVNRFSVAAWLRSSVPLSVGAGTYRMLEKENSYFFLQGDNNPNGLGIGGMNVLVKKGGANISAAIGQPLDANRWYHLAATYDGSTLKIFLDGELKGTRAVTAPIDGSTLPLRIGSDYAGSPRFFNGAIDEVGLWERPLLPSEILQLAGQFGPPTILEQPRSQSKYVGGSAVFQVRARGQGPLRYLWFHGANEIRSATEPTLTLFNVQPDQAGNYRCRISNDLGEIFSDVATLTVIPVTNITDAIEAQWKFDETLGLVAADSSGQSRDGQLLDYPDPGVQWITGQVNGALAFDGDLNRVVANNSASLNLDTDATFAFWINPTTFGTVQSAGTYNLNIGRVLRKGGHFDIEVVDDPGSVRATLRANGVPASQNSVRLNEWQHFTVVFSGGRVRFYRNGFQIGDAAPGNLGASNTDPVVLGNFAEALVSPTLFDGAMDEVGIWARTLSDSEILSLAGRDVAGVPVIVSQPQPATRYVGGSVAFFVDATGKRPVSYEWLRNGVAIPDSNTNRLVLTNLTTLHAGGYTVRVQNDLGSTLSSPAATLTVHQITNVTSGLVAYWPFDNVDGVTLNDASGRAHHGLLQNFTTIPGDPGIIGGALNFDGIDDFVIVPQAPDLNLTDQATISVWVSPRTLGTIGGLGRMVRKDINFDFTLTTAGSTFRVYGLNKATFDAPTNSVSTNQWQHLAVVARDGTLQFFKNGRALTNAVPGLLGPPNTNDLIIGNFGPDLSIVRLFDGYMDELGIWERALSAAEVDGIYQNGLLGRPLDAPFEPLEIRSVIDANGTVVRLVFYSPYVGRQHVLQHRQQLNDGDWAVLAAAVNDLGGGLAEAVFTRPAGNAAFYRLTVLPPAAIFSEDFETGAPLWTHGGAGDNWEVGTPVNGPGAAFSGTNVYATSLTGNIEPFTDSFLHSPPINLTGVTRATLSFQQWRNIDSNPSFHGAVVNVLDATTLLPLQQLSLESGATAGYQLRTLPLPPQVLGREIVVEFRLYCDGFNLLEGWYIDDVRILPE